MHSRTNRTTVFVSLLGLIAAAGIVLSARLYAQSTGTGSTAGASSSSTATSAASSATPSVTCTLTIPGGKSTYAANEDVPYAYSCSQPTFVVVQVVNSDGYAKTYESAIGPYANRVSLIPKDQFQPGNHVLRMCTAGDGCLNNSHVSVPFTVVTPVYSSVSSSSPSSNLNRNGSPATVTPIPLPQYGADKYSFRIDDAGGIREMSIVTRSGGPVWGGEPGGPGLIGACTGPTPWLSLTSDTVTLQTADFPLHVWGTHCASNAVYMFDVSMRGEVFPYTLPVSVQSSSSSSLLRPASGSASTVTSSSSSAYIPVKTGSSSTVAVPGITGTTPSGSAYIPTPPSSTNTTSLPPLPGIPGVPSIVPGGSQQPVTPATPVYRKLSASKMRVLRSKKKSMLKELTTMERVFKIAKDAEALEQLAEFRADLEAFVPLSSSAYELMADFQDEIVDLRLQLPKKTKNRK